MATLTFQHRWLGRITLPVDAIKSIDRPFKAEFDASMEGVYRVVPVGPIKITLHDGSVIMVEKPTEPPWGVLEGVLDYPLGCVE